MHALCIYQNRLVTIMKCQDASLCNSHFNSSLLIILACDQVSINVLDFYELISHQVCYVGSVEEIRVWVPYWTSVSHVMMHQVYSLQDSVSEWSVNFCTCTWYATLTLAYWISTLTPPPAHTHSYCRCCGVYSHSSIGPSTTLLDLSFHFLLTGGWIQLMFTCSLAFVNS